MSESAFRIFCPDFFVVSITDRMIAKLFAPSMDLKKNDTFCLTLMFRRALSKPLLKGGTLG